MTDSDPRVEWMTRTDFAEIAEALGIDSDLVISATMREYGLLVMWTHGDGPHEPIMGTVLKRDRDGIYQKTQSGPTGSTLGDWIEAVRQKMERDT